LGFSGQGRTRTGGKDGSEKSPNKHKKGGGGKKKISFFAQKYSEKFLGKYVMSKNDWGKTVIKTTI